MANSLPNIVPDYRLWVDNIDDIKLLVDEANNYADPRVTIGTIIYAEQEDQYYSIKGTNHKITGYELLSTQTGKVYFGQTEPEVHRNAKLETLWVINNEDVSAEQYINGYFQEQNIITDLRNKVSKLEQQVFSLMSILQNGAIAGDSTHGARTAIMDTYPIATDPLTEEDEPTYDGDTTKPSSLLATIPNLAIKHDTAQNFKTNYQNLINGELIWIRNGENINVGDPGLYIYAANKLYVGFIPIGSGTGGSQGGSGGASLVTIEVTENGVLDILSNKVSVTDSGLLTIDDKENFNVDNSGILIIVGKESNIDDDINTPSDTEQSITTSISSDGILSFSGIDVAVSSNGLLVIDENLVQNNMINIQTT